MFNWLMKHQLNALFEVILSSNFHHQVSFFISIIAFIFNESLEYLIK